MPPATFNLTPALQDVIQHCYPFWPFVHLGQSVHRTSGQFIQEFVLPPALDAEQLKKRVDLGRLHLQRALECEFDRVFQPAVDMEWEPDENSYQYQVRFFDYDYPGLLWKIYECSQEHYNLGCIRMDNKG